MNDRTPEQDALRSNEAALRAELIDAGTSFKGKSCRCPWHTDKDPSAGIYFKDGAWHFRCFPCDFTGDIFDVRARRLSKPVGEVLSAYRTPAPAPVRERAKWYATIQDARQGTPGCEEAYVYTNPATKLGELVVLRIRKSEGGKRFLQMRPADGGGWEMKAPLEPRPIYNRTRLLTTNRVVVVEGEKCCHALNDLGIVATTSPGGAEGADKADWSPLAGKECILWPDNDPPNPAGKPNPGKRTGIEFMKDVTAQLVSLKPPAQVLWIDPDDLALPDKGDVVDYIAQYGGSTVADRRTAVEAVLSTASTIGPVEDLDALIEDTISGKRRAIPFPWPALTRLSRAMMPATVTILAGDPNCGKSFMLLEAAWYWHQNGVRVALFELEDDRAFHLHRALVQLDQNSNLIDPTWVQKNPADARAALSRWREFLGGFAKCITCPTTDDITLASLLKWLEAQCVAGVEVIIIDPITAAGYSGDKTWQEDRDFIIKAKSIVKAHGARLVLSTHPKLGTKKGDKTASLHSLAGGAAYPRFAHSVFWIHQLDKPKEVSVLSDLGNYKTAINRIIKLGKTRNGPGSGCELGFNFETTSLRFAEQGVIDPDTDTAKAPNARAVQQPDWKSAPRAPVVAAPVEFNVDDLP